MISSMRIALFWTTLIAILTLYKECTATEVPTDSEFPDNKCPSPDNTTDAAEDITKDVQRPPSGIADFNVTGVGPYSINISWSTPEFEFKTPIICHFYLNVSFTPSQKGSHLRARHMNCNEDMRSITVATLTPHTNVTIKLSTCLLMPSQPSQAQRFVCTQPRVISQYTADNNDNCSTGYYTNTTNQCAPCRCNNNSRLCETKTGICLACLNGSDGEHCEKCLLSHKLTADKRCEHQGPSDGRPEHQGPSDGRPAVELRTTRIPLTSETVENSLRLTTKGALNPVVELLTTTSQMSADRTTTLNATSTVRPARLSRRSTGSLPIAIIVTSSLIAVAIIICILVIIIRKCGFCRKKPIQFWTIRLQSENPPTISYSDIMEGQLSTSEDNRLIENDFTARLNEQQFVSDENPYRPITA